MDETQTAAGKAWQRARTLIGIALLVLIAYFAWPSNLGGLTTLDVVSGHSMEPKFHTGDLVVARAGITPKVGDVVVYQPPGLKTRALIVHRIIGVRSDDTWVMKGDNNNFIDPFQPTDKDVLGVVVIHIPGVGAILRSPLVWGSMLIIAASLLLLTGASRRNQDDDDPDAKDDDDKATQPFSEWPALVAVSSQPALPSQPISQCAPDAASVGFSLDPDLDPEVARLLQDVASLRERELAR